MRDNDPRVCDDRRKWCIMIVGSERFASWRPDPSKDCPHRERAECDCGCLKVLYRYPSETGHSTIFGGWTGGPGYRDNPGWRVPVLP